MRSKKYRKTYTNTFSSRNKYEKNIFKKFGTSFSIWFSGLKKWQKILSGVLAVVLVLGIALGGYAAVQLNKINKFEIAPEGDLSCVDVDGYLNILLLGVDSRKMDDIKNTGSDAIMILSLKEETGEVKLTSIYRDSFLRKPGTNECYKITDINRQGGPELTIKALNEAMDLNISKFVVVNFKAVADLVNAVDGITVDVQENEVKQLNKYTKQTANNIGQDKYKLVDGPGEQTLEGVQAVSYGRIRKGCGDDFKRTERMRIVLNLVMDKLKLNDFGQLHRIMNAILPNVQTNLSNNDMLLLAAKLANFNITQGESWPYNVTTGTIHGVSYVFPVDLTKNVSELHNVLFARVDYDPTENVKAITSLIASKRGEATVDKVVNTTPQVSTSTQTTDKPKTETTDKDKDKNDDKDKKPGDSQTSSKPSTNTDDKDKNKDDKKENNNSSSNQKPSNGNNSGDGNQSSNNNKPSNENNTQTQKPSNDNNTQGQKPSNESNTNQKPADSNNTQTQKPSNGGNTTSSKPSNGNASGGNSNTSKPSGGSGNSNSGDSSN